MRLRLLPENSPLGWTPFAWLVYLSFFLVLAVLNNTAWDWLIDGPAVAAFLVLYFRGFWISGARLLPIIAGILGIGLITSIRNPGASSFFIFAAGFVGEVGRPSTAVRWLLAIVGITALHSWLFALSPAFWVPAVVLSVLIGGANIHFCEMRRKDRALIRAHEQAEQLARVAERERIARDLHDLLGHTLSVIVLKAELASKLAERHPARAAAEIRDVEQISRHALAEVRRAVHGFRGERLADELAASRPTLEAAGVTLITEVEPVALPADTERTLALALREAVTNVVRHSRASRCVVRLAAHGDTVRLSIEDNGVGGELVEGAGLAGMRERLAEIGGRLERDGRRGTCLTVSAPLSPDLRRLDAFERSGEVA
jgi:two-component system, NarL family, sensor histidine kinase DesK